MMTVRSLSDRAISGLGVALVATLLFAAGCGSSGGTKATTVLCVHASDCTGNLTCTQGYCVAVCASSKDCNGDRCVEATEGPTCQPTEKVTCHYNSDCTSPLVCSGDLQCRSQCQTTDDCPKNQICTTTSKLCADPTVDKNYDPTTMDFMGATVAFGAGIVAPDGGPSDHPAGDGPTGAGGGGPGTGGGGGSAGGGGATAMSDGGTDAMAQPDVGIAASCPGTP